MAWLGDIGRGIIRAEHNPARGIQLRRHCSNTAVFNTDGNQRPIELCDVGGRFVTAQGNVNWIGEARTDRNHMASAQRDTFELAW